jgi:GNAT superfamily N-acetyltransferase
MARCSRTWLQTFSRSVSRPRQGTGIGTRVMRAVLAHARSIACDEAWVLPSPRNTGARRFYASVGGVEDVEAPILFSFRLDS